MTTVLATISCKKKVLNYDDGGKHDDYNNYGDDDGGIAGDHGDDILIMQR